ncbi:hypothetical protein BT69DRAFT_1278209 [Atractiella rhizophila]|nr:hypothetical protein BT69DRAFT_1278209 [Atractiella rhizophila]
MSSLMNFYNRSFARSPYKTLFVTNGVLSVVGDTAAQLIPILSGSPVPFDFERSFRFLTFGCSMGPLIGKWNEYLEYRFPLRPPSISPLIPQAPKGQTGKQSVNANDFKSAEKAVKDFMKQQEEWEKEQEKERGREKEVSYKQLGKRVFADQMFMAPLGLALFLTSISLLEGMEIPDIWEKFKELYFKILLVNWRIWPIIQLINFRYLPLRYRVPYSASMGVLWTIYLSYINSQSITPPIELGEHEVEKDGEAGEKVNVG